MCTNLEKDSMEFLANLIVTNEELCQESTTVELFTHEGYPVPLNQYSKKGQKMFSLCISSLVVCVCVCARSCACVCVCVCVFVVCANKCLSV